MLGVVTNLARLRAIVEHPAFAAGELHTGFIEEHLPELRPPACPPPLAIAALARRCASAGTAAAARAARLPTPGRASAPGGSAGSA